MRTLSILSTVSVVAFAAMGRAQLVIGSATTSSTTSGAYYLDLGPGVAKQLWVGSASGRKVDGLTADNANGFLYNADAARLSRWSFGGVGTPPTFLTGFYRPTTSGSAAGTASGVTSLTFAKGNLYAYSSFASGVAQSGIFRVDLSLVGSTTTPNLIPVWTQANNTQYNFEGLEYDPTTGYAYATNTPLGAAPTTPTGLYRIDLFAATPTVTKIADFETSFLPAPNGLTIGNGKLWLSGKPSTGTALLVESYDLTTGRYGDPYSLELGDAVNRGTDLAWAPGAATPVPEPSCWAALGLGAAAIVRRKRALG